jgi:hypothetical protein
MKYLRPNYESLLTSIHIGNALVYDIHGKVVRNFSLLEVSRSVYLVECHFWGNGVVAISSSMELFVAEVQSTPTFYFS